MADKDFTDKPVEQMTEEEVEGMANFGPSITDGLAEDLEKSATTKERGQQRRLCLAACARSADDLSKLSIEAPDAFGEMLECIEAFREHAQGLAAVADSAYLRMKVADCRMSTEKRQ